MPPETASVLLVDDDSAVRRMIMTYLQRKGISTIDAPSGDAAWQIISRRPSQIQVLITDLIMPGMSGAELVRNVRRAGYFFPVIMITGYCYEPVGPTDTEECLQKPVDLPALVARVNELIAAQCVPGVRVC